MPEARAQADDSVLEIQPTSGHRLLGIEGLRAAAALSVMLGHFNLHLVPDTAVPPILQKVLNVAGQGLTLFFVLSGFLLFGPFLTAAARNTTYDVRQYLTNRMLRIYPGYVVIFLIVAFGLGLAYTRAVTPGAAGVEGTSGMIGTITDPVTIIANLLLIHTLLPSTIKTGLGVSWSLTAEICFYLVLPLLAFAAVKMSPRLGLTRAAVAVSLGMIIVGLACRSIGLSLVTGDAAEQFYWQWGGNWLAVFLRSIFSVADLFGVGMLAVIIYRHGRQLADVTARRRLRQALYGVAAAGLIISRIEHEFGFAVFFAGLLLIVALPAAHGRPHWLTNILEWAPVRWLGIISYSFYLWHLPVIWGVYKWQLHEQKPESFAGIALAYVSALAITTALSAATYVAVERPALMLKSRPDRARAARTQSSPASVKG